MAESIRKLAIIGASARAAAFSAIRAGYEVVAADLFADADLKQACPATRIDDYPQGFAAWLATAECDAWLYTGALENHPDLIDQLATVKPLLGNSGSVLRAVRDPLALQQVLTEAGLHFPETVASAAGLPRDGSWLCKTYHGASGMGVWQLDGEAALARAAGQGAVFQRCIEGAPAAAVFAVSEHDSQLLGVTQQIVGDSQLGAKPWQYAGSVGPLAPTPAIANQLQALAQFLPTRLRLRGLVGIDLIIADDRAYIIEFNPRYTASVEIIERITGADAIAAHVAACTPNSLDSSSEIPPPPSLQPNPASLTHGKAILFAKHNTTISPAFHLWAMNHALHRQTAATSPALADIPAASEPIAAGHPVLTLLASAPAEEYDQVMIQLRIQVETRLYTSALSDS